MGVFAASSALPYGHLHATPDESIRRPGAAVPAQRTLHAPSASETDNMSKREKVKNPVKWVDLPKLVKIVVKAVVKAIEALIRKLFDEVLKALQDPKPRSTAWTSASAAGRRRRGRTGGTWRQGWVRGWNGWRPGSWMRSGHMDDDRDKAGSARTWAPPWNRLFSVWNTIEWTSFG